MILPLVWQQQPDERWCWATVGSIVSVWYASLGSGPAFSPCQVAGNTLGTPCCPPIPTAPPPQPCQTTFDLERALDAIGHRNASIPPANGYALVQQEISNNHPLCALVKFNGGPFHYMVVSGFNPATPEVMVVDPASQVFPMPFPAFLSNAKFRFIDWVLTV